MIDGLVEPFAAPEAVWKAVLQIMQRQLSDEQIALLAAGPVEDLLAKYGAEFIERIETEAQSSPAFKHLLGGIWPGRISSEIWIRVEKSRGGEIW